MQYKYETKRDNYGDFAAGKVLYGYPGHAAFPARLASEIFRRCAGRLAARQVKGPYVLYDPCCGTAIHLATIAFLNWDLVDRIIASDISRKALEFAGKNLSLLTERGMTRRIDEIEAMIERYEKDSHRRALAAATTLRDWLVRHANRRQIESHRFRADATMPLPLVPPTAQRPIDIVFADVPYGRRSAWQRSAASQRSGEDPLQRMMSYLYRVLPRHAIVAIATPNRQKVTHHQYARLKQVRSGKRRVTLLSPDPGG